MKTGSFKLSEIAGPFDEIDPNYMFRERYSLRVSGLEFNIRFWILAGVESRRYWDIRCASDERVYGKGADWPEGEVASRELAARYFNLYLPMILEESKPYLG